MTAETSAQTTDRSRLLELIKELAVVHERVTLSSGVEADYYIDLRRLTLHHRGGPLVGRVMLELTADLDKLSELLIRMALQQSGSCRSGEAPGPTRPRASVQRSS